MTKHDVLKARSESTEETMRKLRELFKDDDRFVDNRPVIFDRAIEVRGKKITVSFKRGFGGK